MTKTPFAGYEVVAPGGSLSQDGYAFQAQSPLIADFMAKVGAVLHRHDAHAAMANPTTAPVLTTSEGGDGTIASGQTIYVAYTLNDSDGGESMPTPVTMVTTPEGYSDPTSAPTGVVSNAAGTLMANTYLYAITVSDGNGGETALGPAASILVTPAAAAEVNFSGLSALTDASSGSAASAGWRMWRSVDGGGTWRLMATGSNTVDTWTDDGTISGDCSVMPPAAGTTGNSYSMTVTVPSAGQPAGATFFNLYACTDGQFSTPSLLGNYAVADFDAPQTFTSLTTQAGSPPEVSLCLPGANQLDPDTDLLYWFWKSPVASFAALPTSGNSDGDVRVVTASPPSLYIWSAADAAWEAWDPGATAVTTTQEAETTYTLQATDANSVVEMTADAASSLVIPTNADAPLPLNCVIEVCQAGAGTVTVTGESGVTIDLPPGAVAQTAGQWASIGLRQRNPNEWLLTGNLAAS